MGFEVQRTKERVNIYGQWYEVKQPTVKEAQALAKKAKETKEDEGVGDLIDYVVTLGVPRDVVESMEQQHFLDLLEYLSQGTKKKQALMSGQ